MERHDTDTTAISKLFRLTSQFNKSVSGIFLSLLFILINSASIHAQPPVRKSVPPVNIHELWEVRERFHYSVRYGCFLIGSVSLELMQDTMYQGQKCHHVKAVIKSNPNLPFVGHREKVYHSFMIKNDTVPYTKLYWTDNVSDNLPNEDIYRLDYKEGKVYTFNKYIPGDTLSLSEPSICGPVSMYYTRLFAGTGKSITVPIFINKKKEKIEMDNHTEIQDIKCGAFKGGHIATYVSHGQVDFDGPFGFNGTFTVWYSADSLRIPVAANLRVWLGNVRIRTMKYEKFK